MPWAKTVLVRATPLGALRSSGETLWYRLKLPLTIDLKQKKKKKRTRTLKGKRSKSSGGADGSVLVPLWRTKKVPLSSCCVALGSTVYSIGSRHPPPDRTSLTRRVRKADLSCPKRGWNGSTIKMKCQRKYCSAVALDGTVYVFGGTIKTPWAEAFNPSWGEWRGLSEPPFTFPTIPGTYALALDDDSKKILVGSRKYLGLYLYDAKQDCWATVDQGFGIKLSLTNPVLVDRKLYWLGMRDVFGYCLDAGTRLRASHGCSEILQSLRETLYIYQPAFLHLSGMLFSLIWIDEYMKGFYYTNLSMTYSADDPEHSLTVDAVSPPQFYPTDRPIDDMEAMLLVMMQSVRTSERATMQMLEKAPSLKSYPVVKTAKQVSFLIFVEFFFRSNPPLPAVM
ncbi:hypothetical protein RJ639_036609 [Escallonia herrerae]|uniref:F-box/kelch-repeat protein n=1 Tax=Escallonia herrerae TaxID=1293975 RepID=A0AA88WT12_9ASTE|nr:hypothetical protein RJ639_036609 [Escallonia herrerae]